MLSFPSNLLFIDKGFTTYGTKRQSKTVQASG